MRLQAWHLIALSLIGLIGGVSATHVWLLHTTASATDYQDAAGRLLGVGRDLSTWLVGPVLIGTALLAWLLTRQKAFLGCTAGFAVLWLYAAYVLLFAPQMRVWRILGWLSCVTLAFSLLAIGLGTATRELSRGTIRTFTGFGSFFRASQYHLWHLLFVVFVVSPFLALARLVIPALEMSVREYLHWNWVYLLLAPIYLFFTLLILRLWSFTQSLAILSFALGFVLNLSWYLLRLSLGGDKIANVAPESPFYDFLLPLGPTHFWIPLVSDILFLVGTVLLYCELARAVSIRSRPR
ncbi:MAG: hypothetical protein HY000_27045 [Planctomycetes bacterium]|nr:hypothetical protein [Planctomycetota bacterium]